MKSPILNAPSLSLVTHVVTHTQEGSVREEEGRCMWNSPAGPPATTMWKLAGDVNLGNADRGRPRRARTRARDPMSKERIS